MELETYAKQARAWLDEHAERRASGGGDREWGEGSDAVALFHNLTAAEEQALIEANCAWQRRKADAGYGSITWPEEYGGSGLSAAHERAFRREEGAYVTPEGHEAVTITRELICPTILAVGTEEQKTRHVRAIRHGDEMWCQLFSEPGAGSDLASLSCRATRHGDRWTVDGQKVWTSGARIADFGYIICRTDPAASRHAGMTAFIFPMDTPGVEVRPIRQMTGGSSFNEVFLSEVVLSDSARLGAVGEGWRVATTTLGFERAARSGGAGGADLFARLVALARHQERLTEPGVRQRLASVYTHSRLRSLNRHRAASAGSGVPGPEGSIAKLMLTQGLWETAEVASMLLGPSLAADTGEWGTYAWAELLNGVPGLRIAGGSDEIQRNILAERILGLPREPGR